ncbi:Ger(x)C family spore germination protein [Halalkalibacterium halodurans]|uniref:Ger(x)C family spore germination protein n=1 Tax=Halalkalibacterium halodurans TaxID=86665 RepID=UPI002AA9916D|nr:Ger(x)C family spore germination protein [Halalkalibacterium halodurans]MDY7221215.1 Ger(x)C family spore germination protein [Halalkalibacterium halodurans]MDY7240454.1 Ger(x)C family spore germination protein [Halalkalibacterium halodurans]
MKVLSRWFVIVGCFILTAGCWDQHLMKNATLIQGASFDLTEEGQLLMGISIPIVAEIPSELRQTSVNSETMSVVANTPREGTLRIERKVPGVLDPSKNKLILFGEAFASEGILSSLDVLYRDPRNPLGARLAVVEGGALEVLRVQPKEELSTSEYLLSIVRSAEENSNVPVENIQTLASEMMDPGEDIVLPFLKLSDGGKNVEIQGLALFDDDRFSGIHLTEQESILFNLLDGEKGKYAKFTRRVNANEKMNMDNYITFNVKKIKRALKVNVTPAEDVEVHLDVHLKVHVYEYPKGHAQAELDTLNEKLSKSFSDDAKQVVQKLQEANCDAFGVGRHLIAFYPDIWKAKDEKTYFQEDVTFHTNVTVEIIHVGIYE